MVTMTDSDLLVSFFLPWYLQTTESFLFLAISGSAFVNVMSSCPPTVVPLGHDSPVLFAAVVCVPAGPVAAKPWAGPAAVPVSFLPPQPLPSNTMAATSRAAPNTRVLTGSSSGLTRADATDRKRHIPRNSSRSTGGNPGDSAKIKTTVHTLWGFAAQNPTTFQQLCGS